MAEQAVVTLHLLHAPGARVRVWPHERDAERGRVAVQHLLHVHAGRVGALVQHAEARAVEEKARHAQPLLLAWARARLGLEWMQEHRTLLGIAVTPATLDARVAVLAPRWCSKPSAPL